MSQELKSVLNVPLVSRDVVYGFLTFRSVEPDAFEAEHLEMAERIAAQIAGPVVGAELHAREIALMEESQRVQSLDSERRRLEEVNEAKIRLISSVSHELRTPLTSITAFSDILARSTRHRLTGKQEKFVGAIQRNGRRLELLVDDLLDLSRLETETFKLLADQTDAVTVLSEACESFEPVLAETGHQIALFLEEDSIPIIADHRRLIQVVGNLLSNAAKYSPAGSQIRIRLTSENDRMSIEIGDDGIGIPEEDRQGLFEPFYRASNAREGAADGTGIGLHVSRAIVQSHGGDISIESELGVGTTVRFWIPIRAASLENAAD